MSVYKKVVLVSGGTSGIGLGTIEYLLEQNSYEVISVSRSAENLSLAKKKLGPNASKVLFLQGDIGKENDCNKIYEEIDKRFHKLDGLVNSAGITKLGGIEKQTLEDWNHSININLTGMFLLTKVLLPLLKKGANSSIVNISSVSSEKAGGSISYCTSKAGVDMLTKYMAQELGKYNIRVNSINPAAVYTNIYIASGDYTREEYDEWSEQKASSYPLGRIGDAKKDLAPTIELLLSDKTLWTTGARYIIDGGKSIAK
ncbi:SDR family NAD(P)-dependent oxidoreductase [Parablautia intestinalis]|uniref:SDR family NAD(P)-dependent oxidoreductase n=1 Tax=Parablautia intestinalis TaxID=2320100 RepID=UPI00256ED507|nr:SDR family oxidoreductase [Parablautia intestinalis]